jgi:hypothetical protein
MENKDLNRANKTRGRLTIIDCWITVKLNLDHRLNEHCTEGRNRDDR